MKPLTKKQRREIYLKVAERIASHVSAYGFFMCNMIAAISDTDKSEVLNYFPEFALFKNDTPYIDIWFLNSEFATDKKKNEGRITMLLFCAEMCKP